MSDAVIGPKPEVIRRVGGLEVPRRTKSGCPYVIRRVGGLEDKDDDRSNSSPVIRRVGGLEVLRCRG